MLSKFVLNKLRKINEFYDKTVKFKIYCIAMLSPLCRLSFAKYSSVVCSPEPLAAPTAIAGMPKESGMLQSVDAGRPTTGMLVTLSEILIH